MHETTIDIQSSLQSKNIILIYCCTVCFIWYLWKVI